MIGFSVPAPFGLRDDVFSILSLPVIFYSAWIFFDGAWRALRARTLDMMVLVAVAIGAGWLYSVYVTHRRRCSTRRPRCWPPLCCWGTGSRCEPVAVPMTRSAHCLSWHRPWQS